MKTKLQSLLLALVMILTVLPTILVPVSAVSPYQAKDDAYFASNGYEKITTQAELEAITSGTAAKVNKYYLANDITLSEKAGAVLNTLQYVELDGNGHIIDGIARTGSAGTTEKAVGALVNTLGEGATVRNLRLNGTVSGSASEAMGMLAGTVSGKVIIVRVHSSATVTNQGENGAVGGLIGQVVQESGKKTELILDNSTFDGTVQGNCLNVGGLIGTVTAADSATLFQCENRANVVAKKDAAPNVGGLVGAIDGIGKSFAIKNCLNYGNIDATSGYAAGLLGSIGTATSVSITDCVNFGNVTNTSTNDSEQGVGGIVNCLRNNVTLNISRCHNFGTLSTNVNGYTKAGGILSTAQNTSASMKVEIIQCGNFGLMEIYDYRDRSDGKYTPEFGGIVGTCGNMKADSSSFKIEGCYFHGIITESQRAQMTKQNSFTGTVTTTSIASITPRINATALRIQHCVSASAMTQNTLVSVFSGGTSEDCLETVSFSEEGDQILQHLNYAQAAFIIKDGRLEPIYALNKVPTQLFGAQKATVDSKENITVQVLALLNNTSYGCAGVTINGADYITNTVYKNATEGKGIVPAPHGTYWLPITFKNVPASGTYTVSVQPFVYDYSGNVEGEKVNGEEFFITFKDGEAVDSRKASFKTVTNLTDVPLPPQGDEFIHFMSYNVQVGNANSNAKMDNAIAMIRKLNPDILGFQEANEKYMAYMKTHLTEYGIVGFGRDSSGQNCENSTATNNKGEGCFILYRKDAYTLKETKTYWLSPTPTVKSQYSIETDSYYRVVTYALLERNADGRQFVFCNNHLEVMGSAQLQTQIRTLELNQVMGYMQPYMNRNVPVILVGDLNMTRADGAFAPMVNAGLKSAEVTAEEVGKRIPTFPGNGLVIDHIMYSEGVHAEFYTVHTDTLNPSDHRPISAWLALK